MDNLDMMKMENVNVQVLDKKSNSTVEGQDTQPKASHSAKSDTVFERYINPTAIVNFGFTLQAAWECDAVLFQISLLNGGPASLVYGSILAGLGTTAISTSLAELASLDPIVGAQYRWSAAFAPFSPKFWGLFQGITVTAASTSYLANVVIGLAVFNYPNFDPQRWHTTMCMIAFTIVPVIANFYFRSLLTTLEMIGGIIHVMFFVVTIVVMVTLSERSTTGFVFSNLWTDVSGWTNPGIAFSLGILTVAFPITSFDGVLHMSDEVQGARTRVPRSMITAVVLNSFMQFGFCVALMYCIGDVDKVTSSPTGLPIIEVLFECTKSKPATNFLLVMIAFVLFVSLFNILASAARLTWAFARDNGLPFSKTFAYVHPTLKIPINALLLVGFIMCLLALIYIGSTTAFNALISLPTIALYISYFIPILFIVIRKIQGRHPKYGPFKLGRWGLPINMFAMTYILYMLTFVGFPTVVPVTADNMNYAGPLVIALILLAIGDFFFTGRKRFVVPTAPSARDDDSAL
ncbi:Choline transport protein [Lachnellula subtilissima]|uniref:Choline transport protein n=1 Tax=Lachnellula subtilissima TaxID=602034 RepID=A0A8H8UCM5_9HELO|nr:Choline transport protein [Lachnellula subtilissima]